MSRPHMLVLAAALLLAAPPILAAQYYKWVDEDGVTHYTQQPPPQGVGAEMQTEAATLPASTPDAPPGGEAAGGDAAQGDEAADGGDDDGPKTVAEFCERMREQEQQLAGDRPVRTKNADGSLEPLEGEARQQRLQQVRGQIEQHCRGDGDSAG